jgi:hypothetical protein
MCLGVLDDGTPYYAPVGEIAADGSRVICHLCGRSLRSVVAHLPSHGWTKDQYCEAFGLERGQSLEGTETHKLRAALFTARLALDPVIREGAAAGLGYGTIAEYIGRRRADGWTWNAISAESGQPATWLRRHEIPRVD